MTAMAAMMRESPVFIRVGSASRAYPRNMTIKPKLMVRP